MKKITKREIKSICKTGNATLIFKLYKKLNPELDVTWYQVLNFAEPLCTKKSYNILYDKFLHRHPYYPSYTKWDYDAENPIHITMEKLRYELSQPRNSYTKRPILGKTHLYFASPLYGHADYNKISMMPIRGYERFCELICKVADKYF